MTRLPPVLVVSGTGTEVGKTVVTAAVAALAASRGDRVAVVKPAQTGEPPGLSGDLDVVRRLAGVRLTRELARFPDPLSPEAAARAAGLPPLDLAEAAIVIKQLQAEADLVLVEGAGGLLVRYDPAGATIADLAAMLAAPVLVVTTPGLGTLNHTALTLEALSARRLTAAGLVIGSWPAGPGWPNGPTSPTWPSSRDGRWRARCRPEPGSWTGTPSWRWRGPGSGRNWAARSGPEFADPH